MRSASSLAAVVLAAAGCAPHASAGGSASPAPSAAPSAAATATAVPIRVETHGGGGKYVTIVENLRGRKVYTTVSYTHLRAHETGRNLVCRLLLEKKKKKKKTNTNN